jgi:hypothetical protein
MRVTAIAAGLLLCGCVDTFAQLYSQIPQYKGRNIDALVDRIGYPDSQSYIAGRVAYTWTSASTVQPDLRLIQAPPVGAPSTPILAVRSVPETVKTHFRCLLQVDTDGSGTILDLTWKGKPGDCAP